MASNSPFTQDPRLLERGIVRTEDGGYMRVPFSSIPYWQDRQVEEPAAQEPVQIAEEPITDDGVEFMDLAKGVMKGASSLGQGVGWLVRRAGMEDIGRTIEEYGANAVETWHNRLSEGAKEAIAKDFVRKNEMGEYEWGDADLGTLSMLGAESLAGVGAGMGLGAGITKVLQVFANPVGRGVLVNAVNAGEKAAAAAAAGDAAAARIFAQGVAAAKKLDVVNRALGAAGFGLGEGTVGGLSAGVNVYDEVMNMEPTKLIQNPRYQEIYNSTDTTMSDLERHQYAAETVAREASSLAGLQAGLTTALLGAPMGAYFGSLFGKKAMGLLQGTTARQVVTGAAGEAAQEFAQSGVEQYISNRALIGAGDTDRDPFEDVLNQAVGGAAAGGALGGIASATNPSREQGTPTEENIGFTDEQMEQMQREFGPRLSLPGPQGGQPSADFVVSSAGEVSRPGQAAPPITPQERAEMGLTPDVEIAQMRRAESETAPAREQAFEQVDRQRSADRDAAFDQAEAERARDAQLTEKATVAAQGGSAIAEALLSAQAQSKLKAAARAARNAGADQEAVLSVVRDAASGKTKPIVAMRQLNQAAKNPGLFSRAAAAKVEAPAARALAPVEPATIPRSDRISARNVKIEDAFAKRLAADPAAAAEQYAQLEGTMGGKILAGDIAKELSPEYLKDRKLASVVHEPASWLVKQMYEKKLAEPPAPGELPEVLFTAGGTGAGKTTGLGAAAQTSPEIARAQIIYDTNMNRAPSSIQKIDQALKAGKTVRILYTYRDPVDALVNGALKRTARQAKDFGSGRTLSLETHTDTHVGANETMREIAAKYRDDPRVQMMVIDNSHGKGNARLVDLEATPRLSYDETLRRLSETLESEFAQGRVPKDVYTAYKSGEPAEEATGSEDGAARSSSDQGSTSARSGRESGQARVQKQVATPKLLFETVPSQSTRAGREISALSFERKQEFTRRSAQAVDYNELARIAGLPEGSSAEAGRGMWQGTPNPGLIETVSQDVSREQLDRMAQAISFVHRQDAVLWFRPENITDPQAMADRIEAGTHSPAALVQLERALTDAEQSSFDEAFGAAFGELSYTAAGQEVITLDFSKGGAAAWESKLNAFLAAAAERGLPVSADRSQMFLAETGAVSNDWTQNEAGGLGSTQALQAAAGESSAAQESLLSARAQVASVEEEFAGPDDVGLFARKRAAKPLPEGFEEIARYLTPSERAAQRAAAARKLIDQFEKLPPVEDFEAAALAGSAKRGWYRQSAQAIQTIFGPVDAPRFAALLAALSPQTSVQTNLYNALNTWRNWVRQGRPTDREAIYDILAESVEGTGTRSSVLEAWLNNSLRALQSSDPSTIVLSGPKVNSFMKNLSGDMQEVTNDTWMANFALIEQRVFAGTMNKAGTSPGKRAGYLAMSAKVRAAADRLGWTPAEVQETVWSWAKTAYEMAQSEGKTVRELIAEGRITDEAIANTPDFGSLFTKDPSTREILEAAGYGDTIRTFEEAMSELDGGDRATAGGSDAASADPRALNRAAERLDILAANRREGRSTDTEVEEEVDEDEEAFASRAGTARRGAQTAQAVRAALRSQIQEVASMVRVEVAQSPSEYNLPADVEGWFVEGRVILFADNLPQGREQEVFVHEVFGHLAMESTPFGKQSVDAILEMHGRNEAIDQMWDEVFVRQGRLDPVTHAKEVVALMAERGDKHPMLTRMIAGVRRFLRSLGIVREYSETDVRGLIARAARAFRADVNRALAQNPQIQSLNPGSSDEDILAAIDSILPEGDARLDRQMGLFSRAAAVDPAIQSIMDRVLTKTPEELTLKDRMRETWQRIQGTQTLAIKQGLIDSFASIEALEKQVNNGKLMDASVSAYKAALSTKNLSSVMAAVMLSGAPTYQNGTFVPVAGRKGILEIFRPLTEHRDGNLLKQWELFAAANRANRLIKEKNPDGTQREKLFTQADIDTVLQLEKKYPEFRQVLNEWNAFNKQILDLAQDAGVIDPAARAMWDKNDYVPFYRAVEEMQGPQNKSGLAGQRSGIKTLQGGTEALGNIFENMMLNTAHLIDASFKNRAMQKIVELGDGIAMQEVPLDWEAVKLSDEQLARALVKAGLIVGNPQTGAGGLQTVTAMTKQQKEHWSTIFRRVAPAAPNVVSVMVNGKPKYYEVTDPLVLKSIAGMGHDNFSDVFGLFRGSKKLLTSAITADPAFMAANFVRDTLSNWVTSGASMHPFIDAVKGLKAGLVDDPVTVQMMMAGAGGGGYYDSNAEDIRKLIAQKVPLNSSKGFRDSVVDTPKKAWNLWRKIGSATENANRIATFKAVLARGGTVAEAAYQARDVLNFSMSGDSQAIRWLVQSVPFMNARIQGLYRLYRGAKDNTRGFMIKGSMIFAATIALAMRNADDDRYEELQEWEKDTYWHVWAGGEHFRIPKPFEVGAIFATIPERLFRTGTGRDSSRILMGQLGAMFMDTFAFNPTPQLVKPIIEQYANRSMFTGSPIVGMAELALQPEAQFTPWTSATMRSLANAMPDWAPEWLRSPRRLEAALRAYTGTMGMYILGMSDSMVRGALGYPEQPARKIYDLPVVKRFLADPNPRTTKYADLMYEMLDESNQIYSTINRLRRETRFEEANALQQANRSKLAVRARLNNIATRVRNVNAQIRIIQHNKALSPQEKRERIDLLIERKNRFTRQVQKFEDLF